MNEQVLKIINKSLENFELRNELNQTLSISGSIKSQYKSVLEIGRKYNE